MSKIPIDYTKTIDELETVVARLQNTETSLDEAIALHEKGVALIRDLEAHLAQAEITIRKQVAGEKE